jgi:hypothetical protein
VSRALEEMFPVCPECSVLWHLHWVYVRDAAGLTRRWNTCGLMRTQLEAKWLATAREEGDRP